MRESTYNNFRQAISRLRHKTIGQCAFCANGRIPVDYDRELATVKFETCSCKILFLYLKELILANIPEDRWNILQEPKNKIVVTDSHNHKRKFSLYGRYINKTLNNLPYAMENSIGLLMYGSPGTGKSTAAFYFIAKAIRKKKSCYYIYLKNLVSLLIESYDSEEKKNLYNEIVNVDILVVDELSLVGRVTPHMVAEFTGIVKERIERRSITILISNYIDIEDIKKDFGAPMGSLLNYNFQAIRFFGEKDLRQIKNERLKSFFEFG